LKPSGPCQPLKPLMKFPFLMYSMVLIIP
jgi:hypothetical protein